MFLPIACAVAEIPLLQEPSAATAPAVIEQKANRMAQQNEKPCAQTTGSANGLQGNTEKSAQLADGQINSLTDELFAKGAKPRQQSCYLDPAKAAELWQ